MWRGEAETLEFTFATRKITHIIKAVKTNCQCCVAINNLQYSKDGQDINVSSLTDILDLCY